MSAIPLPVPVVAAVAGGDPFAVRRIYCVGRNYEAHAREMGHAEREPPFFFSKFPDALLASGATLPYPPETSDLHYEGELVVALARPAFRVDAAAALEAVFGYAAGLDMTRRDLQGEAKKAGKPWDLSKNFTGSAVLGPITPRERWSDPTRGRLRTTVNGEVRQDGDLGDMIWSVAEVIAHLSRYDRLAPGDLIYTGTPAGVGAVSSGDRLEVAVEGLEPCTLRLGPPA